MNTNDADRPVALGSTDRLGLAPGRAAAAQPRPLEAWGIAAAAPTQQSAAEAHCFGDCGKISVGTCIADAETGGMFACFEKTCPHEQQTFRCYGSTVLDGVPHLLHLRVLRKQ
jgi:hypothetical protein